jgi:hypothetical protein
MMIELESGQKLELPDGSTPAQIDEVINHFQSQVAPQEINAMATNVDKFDTVSDQALQGATFGLGNRLSAALAAGVQSGIDGKPFSENYIRAREVGTERLQEEFRQNPKTAIVANLAGGLATGGIGAGTKAGGAVANSLRTGEILGKDLGIAGRAIKGGLAGAASGAAYGGGTAAYGKTGEGAGSGAISGALVGGALPVAGAVLSDVANTAKDAIKGAFAKSPEAVQDSATALLKKGGDLYNQMRQAGAVLNPSSSNGLLSTVDAAIKQQKFIPALNPKTTAIIDDLTETIRNNNGQIGLDELDQYRRMLGRIGNTEDGVSAGAARKAIDNIVDNLQGHNLASGDQRAISLLQQGRQQYKQASKFDDIADIIAKADGDANKIKAGLTRFWKNDDNIRGWSKAEIATLKEAARTSGTEKLLKMGGKFGIDLGSSLNVGNSIGPVVGYGIGGGAAPVVGTVARLAQKGAARGKAQNLLNVLEGTVQPAKAMTPFTGLLSAPGGAAAGQISGSETRAPLRVNIPNMNALPPVNLPTLAPQSSAQPDLFQRVIKQESNGKQSAVSPKGAIGVAQIMPNTAYDAAKAAGLPYDFNRLKNDPEYNAALGKAYLDKMLAKYNGNEAHALVAYNWGPGNADKWIKRGADFNLLPKETQNYLKRILSI